MKCLIDSFDSEFLKAAVAIKLTKSNVIYIEVPSTNSIFPTLELENGTSISSGNEICKYFLQATTSFVDKVNAWLYWENSVLRPAVCNYVLGGSKNDLMLFLEKLNFDLQEDYLIGHTITAADVSIWCSLYPIFSEVSCTNIFNATEKLLSWLVKLNSKEEFQKAQSLRKVKVGLKALKLLSTENITAYSINSREEITSHTTIEESIISQWENIEESIISQWENIEFDERPKYFRRVHPVLPKSGEKNVLITSALPYVNNVPHLGNIIGCVLSADVFSRFCRLRNWNTLFICGTDEYGTAIETKALEEGCTPRDICEKYFVIHSDIYSWFNIDFDYFGRTTTNHQKEIVQSIFMECHNNGYTITETVDQLLCENCDKYLADRFVEGICPRCRFEDARGDQCDGCGHLINAIELIEAKCKICRKTPVVRQSQQFFLDLPKLQPTLTEWFEKTSGGWSNNAKVITKAWFREGLRPRCITRDLKWGIPVPLKGFESKVFYVWFDAPIGYMSMTKAYNEKWLQWWKPNNETKISLYQFMAKDNVPFHSIMFPATLIASNQNYTMVSYLMATEYLNYEDGKFSKSRGVGVFGSDAKDTNIPSDVFRFYLLFIRPESQDSSFSWDDLAVKNNGDLLNNLGNFILRTLTFSVKFFDSKIPSCVLTDEERKLIMTITSELVDYLTAVEKGRLKDGIKYILNISRHGNQYIQSNQPWVLVKGTPSDVVKAGTVVAFASNIVCLLAVMLHPFMPQTSDIIREQTNFPSDLFVLTDKFLPVLAAGHRIGSPTPLFTKIEEATVEALKKKYSGRQNSKGGENCQSRPATNESIEVIENEVGKQAEKVRNLKSSGADKSVVQTEVALLLDLKKRLALAKGEPVSETKGKKKKK